MWWRRKKASKLYEEIAVEKKENMNEWHEKKITVLEYASRGLDTEDAYTQLEREIEMEGDNQTRSIVCTKSIILHRFSLSSSSLFLFSDT